MTVTFSPQPILLACRATALFLLGGSLLGSNLLAIQVDPQIVGPGVVSTDRNETFPSIDPVDGSLWYSVYDRSFGQQTVVRSARAGREWASGEAAPFSGTWGDRAPRFSRDGGRLYFTSNRPIEGGSEAGDMNIWAVQRTEDGWSEPAPVPYLNSEAADIHNAETEQAIWVASNRPGGRGRSDLYRIPRTPTGYGEAEHLGPPLNDELSQPDLWVSPSERWMILVITDHPDGFGGDDLYLSRFQGGAWTPPRNLGPKINSAEYEYGPSVALDEADLYFTSHRNGSADVFRIRLDEVLEWSLRVRD